MTNKQISRRTMLKRGLAASGAAMGGASLGFTAAPGLLRAQPKEIVIGGPAGAAKYFNADIFPLMEKQIGAKILYEGTNSLTNLQKMQADKAAPKMSVVVMDDPVMISAAEQDLIVKMGIGAVPAIGKINPAAVHRDALWVNYQQPWAGIAFNSSRLKTPPSSWAALWDAGNKGRIIVPSLNNTEGYWTLLVAAHLETGKPFKEAQYEIEAGFNKLKSLKPNLLTIYTNAPQAINLLEQGEASLIAGQFSAYTLIRKADGSPIDLAIPKEGGFAMPSGLAKVKNAPGGALADAALEAFLSPEVQTVLAAKAFVAPVNPAATKPAGFPDATTLFAPDWAHFAKGRAGWIERWNRELL